MRINRNVLGTEMPPLVELAQRAGELAAQGADIIRADQGAVDVPPPAAFVDRVAEVLSDPASHRYAPDPGLPALRSALSRYGSERFGVDWDPASEVVVTVGANQGCFASFLALVEPGEEVLLPSPWYFNHAMMLTTIGAIPVPVAVTAEEGYSPNIDEVARKMTSQTRGIAIVNPNNPTGAVYGGACIRALVEFAVENNLWILSDQTYHELHYGGESPLSPAAMPGARESVVTVVSFSKSFGLAGWRLGFLAGPAELVDEVLKIQDCSVICAGRAGQEGLLAALPEVGQHVAQLRDTLRKRRNAMVEALRTAGISDFFEPRGSLFFFLRLPGVKDDWAFCQKLLEERYVVAVPGSTFGPGGEGSIRLSFGSMPASRLAEAIQRIAAAL